MLEISNQVSLSNRCNNQLMDTWVSASAADENFIPLDNVSSGTLIAINIIEVEENYKLDLEAQYEWASLSHSDYVADLSPAGLILPDNDKDEARCCTPFLLSPPEMRNFTKESRYDNSNSKLDVDLTSHSDPPIKERLPSKPFPKHLPISITASSIPNTSSHYCDLKVIAPDTHKCAQTIQACHPFQIISSHTLVDWLLWLLTLPPKTARWKLEYFLLKPRQSAMILSIK